MFAQIAVVLCLLACVGSMAWISSRISPTNIKYAKISRLHGACIEQSMQLHQKQANIPRISLLFMSSSSQSVQESERSHTKQLTHSQDLRKYSSNHLETIISSEGRKVQALSREMVQSLIPSTAKISASIILSLGAMASSLQPLTANAAIASLADVGVKEFLVKDGNQHLRLALPSGCDARMGSGIDKSDVKDKAILACMEKRLTILKNKDAKDPGLALQEAVELVKLRFEQVGVTNPGVWGATLGDTNSMYLTLSANEEYFKSMSSHPDQTIDIREKLVRPALDALSASLRSKDYVTAMINQKTAAEAIESLRVSMLPDKFVNAYSIPDEYASLPRLRGLATVDMVLKYGGSGKGFRLADDVTILPEITMKLVVDGFTAPLTAGNFIDLVDKKFYDGMKMQQVGELTLQTGKPKTGDGYVDPKTNQIRMIPLELFYKGDSAPVYSITSDDDVRATESFALPFQAYGALGMARDNSDPDSGSSQFFILKWRQALVPPGRNTLDGFYTCFGYVVSDNAEVLSQVTEKDTIKTMTVTSGLENLDR